MTDDRIRQDGESLWIVPDIAEIFALQALGRELDRRQGVLDLVRDPARHVRPGGLALRREQLGHVVEGHDIPLDIATYPLRGDPHVQYVGSAVAGDLDLRLRQPVRPARGFLDQRRHFRHHCRQRLADLAVEIDREQYR